MSTENRFHQTGGEEYFYEDESVDWSSITGGLKTSNPDADRYHRHFVHKEKDKSEFKKTVEMVLCVHGWKTPAKTEPMTLLILGVNLTCHAQDSRYQSVRIWLKFHEDDKAVPPNAESASPTVVAYAPWVQEKLWGGSPENVKNRQEYTVTTGVEHIAKLEGSAMRGKESSVVRGHFDRGTADSLFDDRTDRIYGVEWYCEQNKKQNYGIQPYFHIAVLLDRSHTTAGEPITFKAVYDMEIEAGFRHGIEQGIRRIFRLGKPEDEPIYFDPSAQPIGRGKGFKILQKIETDYKDRLGDLAEDDLLTKLLDPVEARLPGLDPMMPPAPN